MSNPTIKQITLPSGTTYDIVDAGARELISALEAYSDYIGVTTTALEDGSTTNPVTINGESVTAKKGNIVNYGSKEFIWNGSAWQEFGDLSALGDCAYVDSVEASYTPAGTVAAPDLTVSTLTASVLGSVTSAGTVPSCTLPSVDVSGEILVFSAGSFSAGAMPTFGKTDVVSGVSATASAPAFTGTQATITSAPSA